MINELPTTFNGIVRDDGSIGTRNYIGVLATENESSSIARKIADYFTPERLIGFTNIDGIIPFTTTLGGAINMRDSILKDLTKTMNGYIDNPNFGGMLVVSMQKNFYSFDGFTNIDEVHESDRLKKLCIIEEGGTLNSVNKGIEIIYDMLCEVNKINRQTVGVENLIVGIKCSGTNIYSGKSANPSLGHAVDLLVEQGATVITSETLEFYGVQDEFERRAVNEEVKEKFHAKLDWWIQATKLRNLEVNSKITMESIEKSLNKSVNLKEQVYKGVGIKKTGTAKLMEVYDYAEKVTEKGLVFMDTPGYDSVAITGQIAGGATIIAFTTGNGSCFGAYPSPVLKISATTELFNKMMSDIDLDSGTVLTEEATIEEMGRAIYAKLIRIASGDKSKAEINGIGRNEYSPWQIGSI
ncbi:MAG: UxaA family hydrolase [Lachnospiraceae bacterium]